MPFSHAQLGAHPGHWQQLAFDQAAIGMAISDADGRWLKVNRALAASLGYRQEELVGRCFQSVTHPEDLANDLAGFARVRSGLIERYDVEKRYIHKRGHVVWMALHVVAVSDPASAAPYFLAQMQDITERRGAVLALAESEARFRSLSASSPLGIFRSDNEGNITYANPRVLQMFGLTEEEGLGRGWLTRIHPDDVGAVVAGWSAALEAREEYAHEYRLLTSEHGIRWVHCRAAPLPDGAGGMAGTVGTVEDITDRRELETQLRQAQKMEAVGRLAGGVAHDFNNLLTIIAGNTEFARAQLEPDSQVAKDLAQVEAASRRAAALTRQLLAFSRKQVLQPRRLNANECVQDLERMLCRLIGENVRIQLRLEPAIWPILADPGQLEQVLMNLVVNARDAMPSGGTVRITTMNVRLDAAGAREHGGIRPGAYVSVAVADDGTGIDASALPHVFEPFFTTKEPGRGTGLGLATVYGIMKQSGGHVSVESTPGHGATFSLLLPCDDSAEMPAASADQALAAGGRETVLVVEDEDAVRAVVRRMLARHGYRVLEAANGADALLLWRARQAQGAAMAGERIDLVLVDAVMPVLGGREVIERIRAEDPGARVLLMTGYTADVGGAEAALATGGVSGFLQKPLSEQGLLEAIRSTLDAGSRIST